MRDPEQGGALDALAVRERAALLELAVEVGRLGTWKWDLDSGSVTWSSTMEAIHGIAVGTFEGTVEAYRTFIHPDDEPRVLDAMEHALEVPAGRLDYRIATPDGDVRWLEVRGRLIHDGTGVPRRLIGVCANVTARKLAEQALEHSEHRFAITLESIGDAVIATDAASRVTFMNPVAERLTGWPFEDAKGLSLDAVFRIVDESTRRPSESPVAKALREGAVVGLANHTVLFCRDGSERSIDDSAAPIRDFAGVISGVVLVFRDVSAKRREERRRAFIHDATRTLTSSLDYEITLALTAQLSVPRVSDWCAIDMLEGDQLRRLSVAHVDPAKVALAHEQHTRYPPDREAPYGVWNVLRTGAPEMMRDIPPELIAEGAEDASHRELMERLGLTSYMIVPMRGSEGVLGAISFVGEGQRRFDEDDLRLAEQLASCAAIAVENALHHRRLQRALRTREELLGIVSHDLRNPLGVMLMSANALELTVASGDEEGARRGIERIGRAGRQMERLIDDLLNFAAIDAGKLSICVADHDLRALFDDALDTVREAANAKSIVLGSRVDEGAEVASCDRQRILQVLANLLGNALEFTPDGGRIALRAVRREGEVLCSVRDTGAGIAPDELPRLFEPYWRGKQRAGGAGLGLYISRGIVAAHRGRIWAESGPSGGTTFFFTLPIAPP